MNPHLPEDRDRIADYLAGEPDAVRDAAPREPSDAQWEATRLRIHARFAPTHDGRTRPHRRAGLWLSASALLTTAAAVLAWVAFHVPAPKNTPAPDVVEVKPSLQPEVALAPNPHEPKSDPLAEFAVLPMATSDEVVLHRVPGDGWLPVGSDPLPGELSLAASDDVELDDPDPSWPSVTVTPGAVPMIFAAKRR